MTKLAHIRLSCVCGHSSIVRHWSKDPETVLTQLISTFGTLIEEKDLCLTELSHLCLNTTSKSNCSAKMVSHLNSEQITSECCVESVFALQTASFAPFISRQTQGGNIQMLIFHLSLSYSSEEKYFFREVARIFGKPPFLWSFPGTSLQTATVCLTFKGTALWWWFY